MNTQAQCWTEEAVKMWMIMQLWYSISLLVTKLLKTIHEILTKHVDISTQSSKTHTHTHTHTHIYIYIYIYIYIQSGPKMYTLFTHFSCQMCIHFLGHSVYIYIYTGCPRRNVPDFGRVFLMLNYTDRTQNTYTQSWTVMEIMAREVWNFGSCYLLITKYILKLAGICGFCNVNICT